MPTFNCLLVPLAYALLLLTVSTEALAWGAKGHRIIGNLAEPRLSAAASAAVKELLEGDDLASASTWADEMRSSRKQPEFWADHAASWHYVNIPSGSTYAAAPKNPAGDAVMALTTFRAILRDEPIPAGPVRNGLQSYFGRLDPQSRELKAFALRFMIHILGDLQQPLHSGFAEDRGGNAVQLRWFGKSTNLHSLWDSQLLNQFDLGVNEHGRLLEQRLRLTPLSEIYGIENTAPDAWIREARDMLPALYYAQPAQHRELAAPYAAQFMPVVETRLLKGGLRTAHYLNTVFTKRTGPGE